VIQYTPHMDRFKQQLRAALQQEAVHCRAVTITKHANVYTCGDQDATVYFIESGQIKLLMLAPDGRECLLTILTAGDIFGELCLSGLAERQETAIAMKKSVLRLIPCAQFFARLSHAALVEGFVQYLAVRIADQQAIIANLVTVDSEQRLGKTLLDLARKLGKQDPRSIRIEQRITHEELAAMVGTTRQRVCEFLRHFCELGLIEISAERFLIVKSGSSRCTWSRSTSPVACVYGSYAGSFRKCPILDRNQTHVHVSSNRCIGRVTAVPM
jgi:CRP/FNR family transcriptional regulator, cyclic AMP receptor protein